MFRHVEPIETPSGRVGIANVILTYRILKDPVVDFADLMSITTKLTGRANVEEKALACNGLPRFLRVEEVAALLRFKKRTIYEMVEQERIPHRRVGGRLLFDADEIIEWTKSKH